MTFKSANAYLDKLLLRVGILALAASILFIGALVEIRLERIENSLKTFDDMSTALPRLALHRGGKL